jgi:hypothetical protein
MENMMAKGIRSYGPGKFNTIVDSYVYELTLDGGADEEVRFDDGDWYGFMNLSPAAKSEINVVASEQDDELTDKEADLLNESVAVILRERSDGIVEADWFSDMKKAKAAWSRVEADAEEENEDEDEDDEEESEEPEEEDDDTFSDESMAEGYVISDGRSGEGYVVVQSHKHFGNYDDMGAALKDIAKDMKRENFYPNVYYVNDHGNIDLLDSEGNVIESRV